MPIPEVMFILENIQLMHFGNEMPTKAVIEVYNEVNGDPIHTQNVNIN